MTVKPTKKRYLLPLALNQENKDRLARYEARKRAHAAGITVRNQIIWRAL